MKKLLFIFFNLLLCTGLLFSFYKDKDGQPFYDNSIIRAQVPLEGNDVRSYIWNSGVFNQDLRTNNTPGFEYPKNIGKFTIFSTGFTLAGYVNGALRLSTASYSGEYAPGYCVNGVFQTSQYFKLYSVKAGDNQFTNQDYANWGLMVPYGAPFKDVNNNGTFEVATDIPGIPGSAQTVFVCLTDSDPANHITAEGFSGGTTPLYNEVHMTAWCYSAPELAKVNFFSWHVLNKGTSAWDSTIASIVCDGDIGSGSDDYAGCDTMRSLGFIYNGDNLDGDGTGNTYGASPPAMGFMFLPPVQSVNMMSSFSVFISGTGPACEKAPQNPAQAYNYMKGYKRDGTPWMSLPDTFATKFCFPGSPEQNLSWNERNGKMDNCGGSLTGTVTSPAPPGDRRFVMSYKPQAQRINPGQSFYLYGAQFSTGGDNNLNSVTKVKILADSVKAFSFREFVIGIQPITTEIPAKYNLKQNYPNPFNPATKINFELPSPEFVTLKIYDISGREISSFVNENLKAGVYSLDWNASNYPSGVYFYKLVSGDFTETKKMVLIK